MNVRVAALYWTDERYVNKRPTMLCLAEKNKSWIEWNLFEMEFVFMPLLGQLRGLICCKIIIIIIIKHSLYSAIPHKKCLGSTRLTRLQLAVGKWHAQSLWMTSIFDSSSRPTYGAVDKREQSICTVPWARFFVVHKD